MDARRYLVRARTASTPILVLERHRIGGNPPGPHNSHCPSSGGNLATLARLNKRRKTRSQQRCSNAIELSADDPRPGLNRLLKEIDLKRCVWQKLKRQSCLKNLRRNWEMKSLFRRHKHAIDFQFETT